MTHFQGRQTRSLIYVITWPFLPRQYQVDLCSYTVEFPYNNRAKCCCFFTTLLLYFVFDFIHCFFGILKPFFKLKYTSMFLLSQRYVYFIMCIFYLCEDFIIKKQNGFVILLFRIFISFFSFLTSLVVLRMFFFIL